MHIIVKVSIRPERNEKQDITGAYFHFAEWAQSDGLLYPDWFLDKTGYRNQPLIYHNSQ